MKYSRITSTTIAIYMLSIVSFAQELGGLYLNDNSTIKSGGKEHGHAYRKITICGNKGEVFAYKLRDGTTYMVQFFPYFNLDQTDLHNLPPQMRDANINAFVLWFQEKYNIQFEEYYSFNNPIHTVDLKAIKNNIEYLITIEKNKPNKNYSEVYTSITNLALEEIHEEEQESVAKY